MGLVNSHGKAKKLHPLLFTDSELTGAQQKALALPQLKIDSREASDLVMLGIGAFVPLTGFVRRLWVS